MIATTVGKLIGHVVTAASKFWKSQRNVLRIIIGIVLVVISAPPVTQYWLSRVKIPDVPTSAIVAMAIGSFFLLTFSLSMYVLIQVMMQLSVERRATAYTLGRQQNPMPQATGGTFLPTDDAKLKDREDIEILKSKGILMETDLETAASEIGHAHLLRTRGVTEK